MSETAPNRYLHTQVMTSSPGELRLLLLDGAIRFLEQGRAAIERKDHEAAYNGISRCQNIIMELMNSLRPDEAPELCQRLSGLYTFMYLQLVTACTERDVTAADGVLDLLRYERTTWSMLLDRLAEENGAGAEAAPRVADDAGSAPRPPADPNGGVAGQLVGGRVSVSG